tara:strand:- start:9 stop:437 length:429 start_codon:yes stop_codon:yes gene_type:complete
MERRVMSDSLITAKEENKTLEGRSEKLTKENEGMRSLVAKAQAAETATSQLRTVYYSHCRENNEEKKEGRGEGEGEGEYNSNSNNNISEGDVVHSIGRALFSGRQAASRLDATLRRLVESEAMVNLKQQELAKVSEQSERAL